MKEIDFLQQMIDKSKENSNENLYNFLIKLKNIINSSIEVVLDNNDKNIEILFHNLIDIGAINNEKYNLFKEVDDSNDYLEFLEFKINKQKDIIKLDLKLMNKMAEIIADNELLLAETCSEDNPMCKKDECDGNYMNCLIHYLIKLIEEDK